FCDDMETVVFAGRMRDLTGPRDWGSVACTSDLAGKVGRARHFDGSGDRIAALAISVPATEFTVAAWFRWTTNPSPYYSGIQGGGDRKRVVEGKTVGLGVRCSQ